MQSENDGFWPTFWPTNPAHSLDSGVPERSLAAKAQVAAAVMGSEVADGRSVDH